MNARRRMIEGGVPLSQSLVWRLQREFYEHHGISAWANAVVPWWVTNTPSMARMYAEVVVAWAVEALDGGPHARTPDVPVTVVELGAGAGIFAYRFLRQLEALAPRWRPRGLRFRYVLTDLVEDNVTSWQHHPQLADLPPDLAADAARVDPTADAAIVPRRGGPIDASAPLVFVANYLFDSLPCDMFRIWEKRVEEGLSVIGSSLDLPERPRPRDMSKLDYSYVWRPAERPRYRDPRLEGLLDEYAATTHGVVPLPVAGIAVIDRLAEWSNGHALLLTGDKGSGYLDELRRGGGEHPAKHGSVSYWTNLHALQRIAEATGGGAVHNDPDAQLGIALIALGAPPSALPAATAAFDAFRGPRDPSLPLQRRQKDSEFSHTPESLAERLEAERGDPDEIASLPEGWALPEDLPGPLRARLLAGLRLAWRHHLHIGEKKDLPLRFAHLFTSIGADDDALVCLRTSLWWYGERSSVWGAIAAAEQRRGHTAAAHYAIARGAALTRNR